MNETEKNKLKETVGCLADELSDKALAAAKEKTNKFWKLLLYAVGIMLAGIAALAGFTGCEHYTPPTAEQVQAVHAAYHALTGEPCVYMVVPVQADK